MARTWMAALALVAVLQGCGGGSGAGDVGQPLASARMALQDPAACAVGDQAGLDTNGNCVTRFRPMAPQRLGKQALGPQYVVPTVSVDQVFNWAPGAYPQFFAGTYQSGAIAVPPFGTFNYRYYPATGNYLAYLGTAIYVYGPVSDYEILLVGQVADFACVVQSCTGSGTGSGTSTGGGVPGWASGGTLSVGVPATGNLTTAVQTIDYAVQLNAGTTYVITMRGGSSGGGSLADPFMNLFDPIGNYVDHNDDAVGTLDAQLTVTPRTSGIYHVAASTFTAAQGSFTISVATTGGSSSGTGTSTGSGSGSGAVTGYVTWTGSINGTTVKDSGNENFQIRASDRAVVTASNVVLTGLTISSSSDVLSSGQTIGYIGLAPAATGNGNVAMFYCQNGSYMDITVAGTWSTNCSTSGSSGGVNTGGSSGGTSGGTSGGSSRGFYTWTGSTNGEVVLDANDERFRFYADNGCIYSDNTRTEYTNFCLAGGASVYFSGETYSVSKVRSTSGSCIAALLTSDGYFADVYSGSGRIQYIQRSDWRPSAC